jgi:hypothetical protein
VTRAEALDIAIVILYMNDCEGQYEYTSRLVEAIGVLHEMNEEFDA